MRLMVVTAVMLALVLTLGMAQAEAKVVGRQVAYGSGSDKLVGYLAFDDGVKGKRPAVLVVHEWWGHNDYARKRARMLARLGYLAFALDMYGDGKQAKHPKEAKQFAQAVFKDLKLAERRFDAALQLLRRHQRVKPGQIAAIGYCFGGGVVLHMARAGRPLRAVASFHGSLASQVKARPGAIKARILVLNGADDPMVTAAGKQAFKEEMKRARARMTFIDYPGAKHAFTNPAADALGQKFKLPLAYNKQADKASWAQLKKFLRASLR